MKFNLHNSLPVPVGPPGDSLDLMPLAVAEDELPRGAVGTVAGIMTGEVSGEGYLEGGAETGIAGRRER